MRQVGRQFALGVDAFAQIIGHGVEAAGGVAQFRRAGRAHPHAEVAGAEPPRDGRQVPGRPDDPAAEAVGEQRRPGDQYHREPGQRQPRRPQNSGRCLIPCRVGKKCREGEECRASRMQ